MNRKQRADHTLAALRATIPEPATELQYADAYQLIVAVILSAQCTDARVNKVTPSLFEAFPTLQRMAGATPEEIYPFIRSVSYPNNKARHLAGMAEQVVRDFGGEIPKSVAELMKLPGVGRKTAQVVASVAFDVDALPVDTHVFRVANRIGLVKNAKTPYHVEQQLKRVIDREAWSEGHHLLILHGRYTCTARSPKCDACPVPPACLYYERLQKLPVPETGLDARRGRYFCKTGRHYFDEPSFRTDRYAMEQLSCPVCKSMNVFETKSGNATRRVPDFRVG